MRADHQRECRDRFGAARDGPSPRGIDHSQNCGDQRAGVADADPEHEIGFVKAPEDRPVVSGDAEAVVI